MVSAGFEPVNLGTKGQHATSRPPKLLQSACLRPTSLIRTSGLTVCSSHYYTAKDITALVINTFLHNQRYHSSSNKYISTQPKISQL
jgi:hypothetical protein